MRMQSQLDGLEKLISSGRGPGLSAPVVSGRPSVRTEEVSSPSFASVDNRINQNGGAIAREEPRRRVELELEGNRLRHPFRGEVYPPLAPGEEFTWGRQEGDLVIFSEIYKSVPGLPRFDGKSMPWLVFIQVFERRVFRVTRNDRVRFQLLEGQLMEDALLFYGSVQEGLTDYGSLKKVLEAYYGDGLSPMCFRIQLRSLVQGVDEGLSQFASRTYRLIGDAWPNINSEAREEMAVDAFLLGCRDRAAVKNLRGGENLCPCQLQ